MFSVVAWILRSWLRHLADWQAALSINLVEIPPYSWEPNGPTPPHGIDAKPSYNWRPSVRRSCSSSRSKIYGLMASTREVLNSIKSARNGLARAMGRRGRDTYHCADLEKHKTPQTHVTYWPYSALFFRVTAGCVARSVPPFGVRPSGVRHQLHVLCRNE